MSYSELPFELQLLRSEFATIDELYQQRATSRELYNVFLYIFDHLPEQNAWEFVGRINSPDLANRLIELGSTLDLRTILLITLASGADRVLKVLSDRYVEEIDDVIEDVIFEVVSNRGNFALKETTLNNAINAINLLINSNLREQFLDLIFNDYLQAVNSGRSMISVNNGRPYVTTLALAVVDPSGDILLDVLHSLRNRFTSQQYQILVNTIAFNLQRKERIRSRLINYIRR